MFEQQNLNYTDLEDININILELQHTVLLFLYVICSIVILILLFLLCLTTANYIHSKKNRKQLEDIEIRTNLLQHSKDNNEQKI